MTEYMVCMQSMSLVQSLDSFWDWTDLCPKPGETFRDQMSKRQPKTMSMVVPSVHAWTLHMPGAGGACTDLWECTVGISVLSWLCSEEGN